jgi:hypothetical protein
VQTSRSVERQGLGRISSLEKLRNKLFHCLVGIYGDFEGVNIPRDTVKAEMFDSINVRRKNFRPKKFSTGHRQADGRQNRTLDLLI